jgi:hypothetical protein
LLDSRFEHLLGTFNFFPLNWYIGELLVETVYDIIYLAVLSFYLSYTPNFFRLLDRAFGDYLEGQL